MMSKQLIGGILAGIVVLSGLGYSLFQKGVLGGGYAPEIMSFVPNDFDQFIYFKVDNPLVEYLIKNGGLTMSGDDFRNIAKTINSMVMYQYITGDSVYSLLFVKDNGGFSLEKASQLGLIPDAAGYESIQLSKDILVYGATGSLAYFNNFQGSKVSQNTDLKAYFKDFGGYNVGFVSRPLLNPNVNPMIAQFANKLQYTQVKSKIGEKLAGSLRMQFSDNTLPIIEDSISSELIRDASLDSSLVLEIKNLLKLFSIEKSQFASLAGLGIQQISPEIAALLKIDDYETLYDVLNGQMMIEVKPSNSMLGVSVRLIFKQTGLLGVIENISPVLGGLLSNIVGTGNVNVSREDGVLNFSIVSPLIGIIGSGNVAASENLSVYAKNGMEVLSLFETPSSGTFSKTIPSSHPNSLAVFYSQGPAVNSMVGLPVAQEGSEMVAMQGSIYTDKRDALVVEFEQK